MSWTEERVALLKKLWGEGKTAAEIAVELGGVTRNAVIGKAHRLKLSGRASPIQANAAGHSAAAQSSTQNTGSSATKTRTAPSSRTSSSRANPETAKPARTRPAAANAADETLAALKASCKGPEGGVQMADLKERTCRWPVGDPRDPDFHFCGASAVPGMPYCEYHARLAYQAAGRGRTIDADDIERQENARRAAAESGGDDEQDMEIQTAAS